jgi:hypothetical protein
MFAIGPVELLVLVFGLGSGLLAAAYLALALRRNAGRGNRRP